MELELVNQKLADLKTFAQDVKKYIVENKLFVEIQGKNYVYVEGWQFMGGMLGIDAVPVQLDNQSVESELKYSCVVELVNKDGKLVGRGFAICSNKEKKKTSFDEYAIASMAQTRAIGKAYRMKIGWLMKLTGYEGTPAEETDSILNEEVSNDKLNSIVGAHKK